ncbi:MAG: SpoIIE family protein phosphatase [Nocardioidaceae bacterium]
MSERVEQAELAEPWDGRERRREDRLLAIHRRLLERIASAEPLPEILHSLVGMIEEQSTDGMLASILIADPDGRHLHHGAAHNLPAEYNAAIDGLEIGPAAGSCGTAAYRRETVIVADIDADPLWADHRNLARLAGVRACWSTPLMSRGEVLGTFAMYYQTPHVPSADDREAAAMFSQTATFAIERHRAEEARDAARAVEYAYADRLTRLAAVSLDLSAADTLPDLTHLIIEEGISVLGADGGAIGVIDEERGVLKVVLSDVFGAENQRRFAAIPMDSDYPATYSARTGETLLLPTVEAGLAHSPVMQDVYTLTDRKATVTVPLVWGERTLGSLSVAWIDEREVSDPELELIERFAAQCAQSLERVQVRLSQRRAAITAEQMSEALQRSLLTRPPQLEQLSIAVRYLPAMRQAQVGGDWYDAFLTTNDSTMLVVGDVNGHDRDAAAMMGQLRNLVRGLAYDSGDPPAALLTRLDRALRDLELDALATAVVAQVLPPTPKAHSVVRWSSAGHLPPLLRDADGTVSVLTADTDLMLGITPETTRRDHIVELRAGSTLLLYTDGLVERRDEGIDEGVARLQEALAECGARPVESLCDALVERMVPDGGEDDMALIAVRPRPGRERVRVSPAEALPIRSNPRDVREARAFVETACRQAGVAGDVRDTAILLTSEIVTNAIVHAATRADLTVTADDQRVRVEVVDGHTSLPYLRDLEAEATDGRGLVLVHLLASRWGAEQLPEGKLVWFELDAR